MTWIQFRILAARCVRVMLVTFASKSEGAGNAGRPTRPQPRMQNKKAYELVTTVTPEQPGIPRAMVYGLFRALPGDRAFLTPSPANRKSTSLTPPPRRQDHTSSPSASAPFVKGASTSTASRPASVTIASRPSVGRDSIRIIQNFEPVKLNSVFRKIRSTNRDDAPTIGYPIADIGFKTSDRLQPSRNTGSPAFAGDDIEEAASAPRLSLARFDLVANLIGTIG